MIIVQHPTINISRSGEKIFIMNIGDVHFDSPGFCASTYRFQCERAEELASMGKLFFTNVGDLEDCDNSKMRNAKVALSISKNRYDAWKKDSDTHRRAMHYEQGTITRLQRLLKHGKMLGGVAGNHYKIYPEGLNSAQYIANYFGYPYLGEELGFIRLNFKYKTGSSRNYDIMIYHGAGKNCSSDGAKLKEMINGIGGIPRVDLVVRGHSHELETKPKTNFYLDDNNPPKLREKKTYFLANGSMLRGYINGEETYAERRNYKPTSLCWGEAELTMFKDHTGNFTVRTRISYT